MSRPAADRAWALMVEAIDSGLAASWSPGEDYGGARFVAVQVAGENLWARIVWHTRETGTYRLFSCIAGRNQHNVRDVPVKRVRELIAEAAA